MPESAVVQLDTLRGSPGGTQPRLTPRELEVLRLFALGRTWHDIERTLHIGHTTLCGHRAHISEKVGGGSLVDMLRAVGWLTVPEAA